ncbi:hypothetical protein EC991_002020 [Linnemannia zychae]|nr:hypothetical protein EC991_002020 [Linnemannia zychae]
MINLPQDVSDIEELLLGRHIPGLLRIKIYNSSSAKKGSKMFKNDEASSRMFGKTTHEWSKVGMKMKRTTEDTAHHARPYAPTRRILTMYLLLMGRRKILIESRARTADPSRTRQSHSDRSGNTHSLLDILEYLTGGVFAVLNVVAEYLEDDLSGPGGLGLHFVS